MRALAREQGRFVSRAGLRKVAGPPDGHYALIIVDRETIPGRGQIERLVERYLCSWVHQPLSTSKRFAPVLEWSPNCSDSAALPE